MLGDNLDIKTLRVALICILSTLALLIIFIFKLITGSYLLGLILFIALLWFAIFKIGIIIMYPGSSAYFTSQMQTKLSNQHIRNLHQFGHCLQAISQAIISKSYSFDSGHYDLNSMILGNIHYMIECFGLFQQTLSERKANILEIFRNLLQEVQYKNPETIHSEDSILKSIAQFLINPRNIRKISETEHKFLCQRIAKITELNATLQQVLETYKQPEATFDALKHQYFGQKFYEIRFAYQRWTNLFEYQVHLINNVGLTLQCAIIKRQRTSRNSSSLSQQIQNKFVMFCNPNGVYIQFFAVQNAYIRQYLKEGYQIILWNYRGYAQSTGSPSIVKSQSDAMKVYNYFSEKNCKIQVVHGYSIGGCAAIGLVSKLQEKQSQMNKMSQSNHKIYLRKQCIKNNIKLLIVDRSFSSIGNMAIQFGPTLHKLAKIIFSFENKNLSKQFSELKTNKLIIWDHRDQVIPDSASLKGGILSSILGKQEKSACKNCSNCYKDQEKNNLNQQKQQQEDLEQLSTIFIKRFNVSLKTLLSYVRQTQSQNPNEEHPINNINMTDSLPLAQQIVFKVFSNLYKIDGGGSFLPEPISTFKKFVQINPLAYEIKCQSYLLGLIFYGSLYPLKIAFSDRTQIQKHTIEKIQDLLDQLNKIVNFSQEQIKQLNPSLVSSINNLILTFKGIKQMIEKQFHIQQRKKFGKLIAVSNGHNGPLSREQLNYLIKYVKQVCQETESINQINQLKSQMLQQNQEQAKQMSFQMRKDYDYQQQVPQEKQQQEQMTQKQNSGSEMQMHCKVNSQQQSIFQFQQ